MEGNTPGRRPRAVSFTIQLVGADEQRDLPNAPGPAGNAASTSQQRSARPPTIESEDVEAVTASFQEQLESLANALLVITQANQDADARSECVQALNQVAQTLEQAESKYMSSPLRCPLIHARSDYAVGTLASMALESLYADGHEALILNWIVDAGQHEEVRRAATRLVCILLETQPHLSDELAGRFNIEELVRAVITSDKGELRTYQVGFLGLSLNDRRSHQMADMAVIPQEIDDAQAPQGKRVASLPAVLVKRIKEELAVEFDQMPQPSSPQLSTFPELEYTLRCLSFLGEYHETLSPVSDMGLLETLLHLLRSSKASELLKFYTLELCSRLMAHKSFAVKFSEANGIELLLSLPEQFPRPLFFYPSIAWCLSGIASLNNVMENVLKGGNDVSRRLVDFGLRLLNGEQDITRKNGLYFFAHAFAFPVILHQFDASDGCKILLGMLNRPVCAQRSIAVLNLVKHTVRTLREYFRAHVAQAAHLVRTTRVVPGEGNRPARATAKRLPPHKPLSLDPTSHLKNMETLAGKAREVVAFLSQTKWRPVEELLQFRAERVESGIGLLLGIVRACSKEFGANAQEASTATLQVLSIASILPITHAVICGAPTRFPKGHFRAAATAMTSVAHPGLLGTEVGSRDSGEDAAPRNDGTTRSPERGDNSGEGDENDDEDDDDFDDNQGFTGDDTGVSLLLQVASGAGSFDDLNPKALLSSLQTLCNCVCPHWSVDEASYRQARGLARNNNAVMILLALLNYKEKPSEADPIRFYACDALYGLSGDNEIAEILKALNVDRVLSDIANSVPIVAENAGYHKRLKGRALDLLKLISSGVRGEEIALAADATARKIARDAIVRRSNVQWNQKELMWIIHEHLEKHGCTAAASALAIEAGLTSSSDPLGAETPAPGSGARPWPTKRNRRRVRSAVKRRMLRPVLSVVKRAGPGSLLSARKVPYTTPGKLAAYTPSTSSKDKEEEVQVTLVPSTVGAKRRARPLVEPEPVASSSSSASKAAPDVSASKRVRLGATEPGGGVTLGPSAHPTALEKIVREHLRHQHQSCRNPVTTPAPFSLVDPKKHSCPDPKPVSSPNDAAMRIINRQLQPPFGGMKGRQLMVRNAHSKAKWVRSYLLGEDLDFRFTTQAFRVLRGNDDQLVMGTSNGLVHRYNAWTSEYLGVWDLSAVLENDEAFANEEDLSLSGLGFSREGSHFLTNLKGSRSAIVWRVLDEADALVSFKLKDVRHAVLDVDGDTIAAVVRQAPAASSAHNSSFYGSPASTNGVALYSMESGDQVVRFLSSEGYNFNGYSHTNICMSPGGQLVCYDGVLWDARRSQRPIHKFDKLSEFGWGSLHPNGLQLLLDKDVWDLRTFRIVQTCSNALNGSSFRFDPFGDVIYSFQDVGVHRTDFASNVVVTDGTDYTNIASVTVSDHNIYDLAIHPSCSHFSVIVAKDTDTSQTEGRLYEIGRAQPDEDDSDINEPIEQDGDDSASEDDEDVDEDEDIEEDFDESDEIVLGDLAGNGNFGDAIMRAINMFRNPGGNQGGGDDDSEVYEEEEGESGDDDDGEDDDVYFEGDGEDDEFDETEYLD